MSTQHTSKQNHLLAALPETEWLRWLPWLERIDMPLGQVLYESGATLNHVYFPTTAIVSLLYSMENGTSAEIAVVVDRLVIDEKIRVRLGDSVQTALRLGEGVMFALHQLEAGGGASVPASRTQRGEVSAEQALYCTYCCAIPKRLLLKWRKPQYVIGIIL